MNALNTAIPAIEYENVSFGYTGKDVLKGVSFKVNAGEMTALVGPSGGEKQRISIARCILKDAPIVILDEATASVDADNEKAIQDAISELCRNKHLLVLDHRLKTIKDAAKILVVSDGQIVERGDHKELCELNGTYANMVSLQASGI